MSPGKIITFEEFSRIKSGLGKVVCTSGGFDPIHPGHVSCIHESKKYGDTLVVIVNGDSFLKKKKGKAFMDIRSRCAVVSHIKGVDYVIPFEIEDDQTVCEALSRLRPDTFTKGGDRIDAKTIPEWDTCKKYGIKIVSGVGHKKEWSSSDFLREWGEFWRKKEQKTKPLPFGSATKYKKRSQR